MKNARLIIINFEGVLGAQPGKTQLTLRHGAVSGVKRLLANFQVAIVTHTRAWQKYFQSQSVYADAVYTTTSQTRAYSYENIIADFGQDTKQVLVIAPYDESDVGQ
jgi:hypothetical protein